MTSPHEDVTTVEWPLSFHWPSWYPMRSVVVDQKENCLTASKDGMRLAFDPLFNRACMCDTAILGIQSREGATQASEEQALSNAYSTAQTLVLNKGPAVATILLHPDAAAVAAFWSSFYLTTDGFSNEDRYLADLQPEFCDRHVKGGPSEIKYSSPRSLGSALYYGLPAARVHLALLLYVNSIWNAFRNVNGDHILPGNLYPTVVEHFLYAAYCGKPIGAPNPLTPAMRIPNRIEPILREVAIHGLLVRGAIRDPSADGAFENGRDFFAALPHRPFLSIEYCLRRAAVATFANKNPNAGLERSWRRARVTTRTLDELCATLTALARFDTLNRLAQFVRETPEAKDVIAYEFRDRAVRYYDIDWSIKHASGTRIHNPTEWFLCEYRDAVNQPVRVLCCSPAMFMAFGLLLEAQYRGDIPSRHLRETWHPLSPWVMNAMCSSHRLSNANATTVRTMWHDSFETRARNPSIENFALKELVMFANSPVKKFLRWTFKDMIPEESKKKAYQLYCEIRNYEIGVHGLTGIKDPPNSPFPVTQIVAEGANNAVFHNDDSIIIQVWNYSNHRPTSAFGRDASARAENLFELGRSLGNGRYFLESFLDWFEFAKGGKEVLEARYRDPYKTNLGNMAKPIVFKFPPGHPLSGVSSSSSSSPPLAAVGAETQAEATVIASSPGTMGIVPPDMAYGTIRGQMKNGVCVSPFRLAHDSDADEEPDTKSKPSAPPAAAASVGSVMNHGTFERLTTSAAASTVASHTSVRRKPPKTMDDEEDL